MNEEKIQVVRQSSPWSSFWKFLAVFLFVCGLCSIVPFAFLMLASSGQNGTKTEKGVDNLTYTYVRGKETSDNKILAVYIDQPILTSSQEYNDDIVSALLTGQYVYGYKIKDQLMQAVDDKSIKGVVLMINSPGGTVVGARAISEGISYYTAKTGNPVYAYVEDMAASGAYWAAASADKIYAEQGSLVGSIGVIMGPFEYYDKLVTLGGVGTQNGISINYITGGKYKDLGNPTKKISEDEMKVLQTGIDSEYDVFVNHVSSKRRIPTVTIKEDIKALIYGAQKAKEFGLIDEVANREDVLMAITTKAGISDDYKVVKIGTHTSLFDSFFSAATKDLRQEVTAPVRVCVLCGKPLYFYGNPLDY